MRRSLHGFTRISRICVILMGIMNVHNWNIWSIAEETNPVCNTDDCKKLGAMYVKNMNKNGNPCADFYDYACHGWPTQFPKPNYTYSWAVEIEMEERAAEKIKQLLETSKSNSVSVLQAKALYNACLNLPYMERRAPADVKNIMKKVGHCFLFPPTTLAIDWWKIDTEYIKRTGESALFDFHLIADQQNNSTIIPQLKRLESPYGMLNRYEDWGMFSDQRDHYKAFLIKMIESIVPQDIATIMDTIDFGLLQIIKLREVLREVSNQTTNEEFKIMTITELQEWYDAETNSHPSAQIDWLEIVRAIYKNSTDPYGDSIDEWSMVSVQKNYFTLLATVLGEVPDTVIVNHIHLYFAERHILLTTEMEGDLNQSYIGGAQQTAAVRYEMPRWRWCVQQHNMGLTLRRMYVESVFSTAERLDLENLFNQTQEIMMEQISESTWIDAKTKKESIEKIKYATSTIGYPDWLLAPTTTIQQDISTLDPLIGNAFYTPVSNHIFISAAYLQWPMYSINAPYVILFGATMSTIAHELYHALDQNGVLFDKYGATPGWTETMYTTLVNKSQCFEKQFDGYKKEEMKELNLDTNLETENTVDEDIPDVMGLKLSYRAFKRMLEKSNGTCPILPGFEDMNCEQLFFIAFANTACAMSIRNVNSAQLLYDPHSLNPFRVNGAVGDMKAFDDAFGCKPNDPLNLKHKCDIWKA